MKAYTQNVLSAPARTPVMVKKGRKMIQLVYTTKSGDVKNKYVDNKSAKVIKHIKHSPR